MSNLIRVELDDASKQKIESIEVTAQNIERLVEIVSGNNYEPDSLMKIEEVEKMISFTRKWIYAKMKVGLFPKPIKLMNASRWKLKDVQDWINSQKYM